MDPLKKGPDSTKTLFEQFSRDANGFPHEAVVGAAINVLLNTLRQQNPKRSAALKAYDELMNNTRAALMAHYDGLGNRRNIFPFNQTIEVPKLRGVPDGKGGTKLVPDER